MAEQEGTIVVRPERLRPLVARIFTAAGAPETDAETVAEVLVEADLRGVESHGTTRVAGYVSMMRLGLLNPRPKVVVLRNPEHFMPLDEFRERIDRLVRMVKASERARGVEEVFLPGEIEFRKKAERERAGIPLSGVVHAELKGLARELAVPFDLT